MFATFAYFQIFNMLNARVPGINDNINPFNSIHTIVVILLPLILIFQFVALSFMPGFFGIGKLSVISNFIAMGIGASSVLWFIVCKAVKHVLLG